jgi:hypothetical protein
MLKCGKGTNQTSASPWGDSLCKRWVALQRRKGTESGRNRERRKVKNDEKRRGRKIWQRQIMR